jgi:hypothetical protein|tara:strand:+ start:4429 stop:4677 length:249 start_codon:yes stop_codon:yes gene_type:complete
MDIPMIDKEIIKLRTRGAQLSQGLNKVNTQKKEFEIAIERTYGAMEHLEMMKKERLEEKLKEIDNPKKPKTTKKVAKKIPKK